MDTVKKNPISGLMTAMIDFFTIVGQDPQHLSLFHATGLNNFKSMMKQIRCIKIVSLNLIKVTSFLTTSLKTTRNASSNAMLLSQRCSTQRHADQWCAQTMCDSG
jgi:hypothetical protein